MKCNNCGKVLKTGTKFCSECGARMEESLEEQKFDNNENKAKIKKKNSGIGLAGFILGLCGLCCVSIIMSILGVVFSSIALKGFDEKTQKNKGFAVAGLTLAIIGLVFAIIKTVAEWHWQFWVF